MSHRTPALSLAVVLLALAAAPVLADEIAVDGKPMSGKVVKVTSKGLEVETTYGKGNVLVPYDKITTLQTDEPFTVISGDEGEVVGKLVGVRGGDQLLVGETPETASAVAVGSLFDSVPQAQFDGSGLLRWKSRLRYWNGHYDLAFAGTDATVNSIGFSTGFEAERTKAPAHLLIGASYRYATTNDPSGNNSKTELNASDLLGLLRGEYDLTERFYAFGSFAAEYDEVDNLKPRLLPKAGPGVRILNSDDYKWNADIGGSYVYERYNGGSENKYAAVAFGTDGSIALPWGSKITFRGQYLPAVDDWARTYLLIGTANLVVPMTEWLSFKTGVLEQYNNTPAADTARNSVTGTVGLSLVF
ncbi:MAG TPA: DUF481 domain-containing protein [Myxococcota bacterium]|nr:DUF481 domain-containing protein [Myxococcota bacterium]